MPVRTSTRTPNGHDTAQRRVDDAAERRCPYCGQEIVGGQDQADEILARIENTERTRLARLETALKQQFTREQQQAQAKVKVEIAKAVREATATAEKKLKLIRQNQDAVVAARVNAERERAAKKQAEAVNAEKLQHAAEKLRLETALADMQRRLQQKTAHQIGEPAEVDLFDALVAAFPSDRVSRIVKGVKGPDVLVEVVHSNVVIGKIVLDSKAHARWSNKFTAKLRADQIAEGADFAILSTAVFPAGAQQLHVQDHVIVADPARVPVLVHLLRRQIVDNCMLKLGAEARDAKAGALYDFILSPACDDMFDRLLKLTRDAQALDAAEAKAHQATWLKRAELLVGVLAVREQFVGVVADIVGGGR